MSFQSYSWLLLLLLVIPFLAATYIFGLRKRNELIKNFVSEHLLETLTASWSRTRTRIKATLVFLAFISLILALARPSWDYEWQETKGKGIDVLFAVDTSKSMLAEDLKPNRLERAKLAILDLLAQMKRDRVGLIAFSGESFLQCPLTLDYDAFRQSLEVLDTHIIQKGGTNLASAIKEAESSFSQENNFKFLVLITDGEDLAGEGLAQAKKAAANGMTIFTVGVGSTQGELIPISLPRGGVDFVRDENGKPVKTQLDEAALIKIAEETNGFYVPLTATGQGLEEVYEAGLSTVPPEELSSHMQKVATEHFQIPLALAIFILLLEPLVSTRRTDWRERFKSLRFGRVSHLLVLGLLIVTYTNTLNASAQKAAEFYIDNEFDQATEAYEKASIKSPHNLDLKYNLANSLYKENAYEKAEPLFEQVINGATPELQGKAYYNLGNTLYRIGEQKLPDNPKQTIENWEKALTNYANAKEIEVPNANFNYEFVKEKLEELKKQEEEKEKPQETQDQDSQEKEEDSSDSQPQDNEDSSESQNSENKDNKDQNNPSKSESSEDSGEPEEKDPKDSDNTENKNDDSQSSETQSEDTQQAEDKSSKQNTQQDSKGNRNEEQNQERSNQGSSSAENTEKEPSSQSQPKPQPEVNTEEQPPEEKSASPQPAESGEPETSGIPQPVPIPGAMTREEARQLLDSMRDEEKKLPLSGFSSGQTSDESPKSNKDW